MASTKLVINTAAGATQQPSEVCIVPTLSLSEKEEERAPNTGTKLSPICMDAGMKEQSTPTEELSSRCFPNSFSLIEAQLEAVPGVTSASFASHSTSTVKSKQHGAGTNIIYSSWTDSNDLDGVLAQLMQKSAAINENVTKRSISRHGRSGQRWIVDSHHQSTIRLVTGCVPILQDGKIMMVSAGKKKEWILPKGGWEMDEEMEESAIRETFEEAGVIGVLGPKLSEVQYETRKAKERRMSLAEQLKSKPESAEGQFCSGWSDVSQLSEDEHLSGDKDESSSGLLKTQQSAQSSPGTNDGKPKMQMGATQAVPGKPIESQARRDAHVTIESAMIYSHVCVNLFPLYVKEVMASWPESGRLRKAVDIDEAIALLAKRPEIQSILLEVKAKGLHLV